MLLLSQNKSLGFLKEAHTWPGEIFVFLKSRRWTSKAYRFCFYNLKKRHPEESSGLLHRGKGCLSSNSVSAVPEVLVIVEVLYQPAVPGQVTCRSFEGTSSLT